LHVDRIVGVFPMIVEARFGVDLLVDIATQGYTGVRGWVVQSSFRVRVLAVKRY